jgi:hypothetical protein
MNNLDTLSVSAVSNFTQRNASCFEIFAPREADEAEKSIHDFLDSIDLQFVNSLEQYKAEEREIRLNSSNIKKSYH